MLLESPAEEIIQGVTMSALRRVARPLADPQFRALYSELLSEEKPVGNGIIGIDSSSSSRLYYAQRGFYTEAAPSDPVILAVAVNPGTPRPDEAALEGLVGETRLETYMEFVAGLAEDPRSRFFAGLQETLGYLLDAPPESVFKYVVFTNVAKQSTRQQDDNWESPDLALIEHGLRWLNREIQLWQPEGLLVLGSKARKALLQGGHEPRCPIAYVSHPSARISNDQREEELYQAREHLSVPLSMSVASPQPTQPRFYAEPAPRRASANGKISGWTRQRWVDRHRAHRFYVLSKHKVSYPKPKSPWSRNRQLRPAFAHYALMVALDGMTIAELDEAATELAHILREGAITDWQHAKVLSDVIQRLLPDAGLDEVADVIGANHSKLLRNVTGEVGWCYQRRWVMLDPPPVIALEEA